ncbi:MAG: hypothetical protein RL701_7030 [Pseudomonadota bacterium]
MRGHARVWEAVWDGASLTPRTTKPAQGGLPKLLQRRRYLRAGEGIRTLDVNLGKVALYH